MRRVPWRLLGLAVVTAGLLDLPFPLAGPLPVWRTVFAWFALVPLLMGLLRLPLPGESRRWTLGWSAAAGWLCGAVWFDANCYWVYDTVHLYGGMNGPTGLFAMLLFGLYLGFWFGVFALALAGIRLATMGTRSGWLAFAGIPFLWVAMEFALARIPEFPWDLLGYSQVDNALLMRLAPWTGVYGISFLVAGVNALLAAGLVLKVEEKRADGVGFSVAAFCGCLGLSIVGLGMAGSMVHPARPSAEAMAVLIQPNLDVANDDVWVGPEWDRRMAQFAALGRENCGPYIAGMPDTAAPEVMVKCAVPMSAPALIAWPESPAGFRDNDPVFRAAMAAIVKSDRAPLIVGDWGLSSEPASEPGGRFQIYNSASVVSSDGRFVGRYDKMHLVPFGEYVPMRDVLFFAHKLTQNLSDLSVGAERTVFAVHGHRYGVFICYESVFGDEIRQFAKNGAEVLVNISDDGWYGDTSAPWQHLNMARMRAAENRRWILRDTNNGVTSSIDPYGTVRQSIRRHEVGALAARFGYGAEMTFYTMHGDWVAWGCALVTLIGFGWAGRTLLQG